MKSLWIASSLFLALACSWFAVMELILRHPGFAIRSTVAVLVVLYSVLAIAYARVAANSLRPILTIGSLGALLLGSYALYFEFRTIDFEGYIFLIALGLIAQGILTFINTRSRPRPATSGAPA